MRNRRAERGEVRYLILDAVSDKARHGYEIIQTIEKKTGGAYRPSPGTVYPTLQMLEEMDHVRSKEEAGRRVYEITEEGRADLDEHRDEVEEAYDRLGGDEELLDTPEIVALFQRFPRLMRTLGRALRRGRLGTVALRDIGEILDEAIDRIEKITKSSRRT